MKGFKLENIDDRGASMVEYGLVVSLIAYTHWGELTSIQLPDLP